MRDNNTILRETLRELHDMMLIKGNDTPIRPGHRNTTS